MKRELIKPLQFFRFMCFLFIFGWHGYGWYPIFNNHYAARAVSFFVIISGFMMYYNYYDKIYSFKFKEFKKFLFKKIKKFYPLFLLTSILPFYWRNFIYNIFSLNFNFIMRVFKYLLLLQIWFPSNWFDFNGVAWFLSLTVFLYFSSFFIYKFLHKFEKNGYYDLILFIILYILLYFYVINFSKLGNDNYFLYIFPIPRLIEFTLGSLLASIYMKSKEYVYKFMNNNYKRILVTLLEIIVFVFYIVTIKETGIYKWQFSHILPNIILIFIFSFSLGYISKFLSNRIFVYLGGISFELFITHQILMRFLAGNNFFKLKGVYLLIYMLLIILLVNILYCSIRKIYYKYKKI